MTTIQEEVMTELFYSRHAAFIHAIMRGNVDPQDEPTPKPTQDDLSTTNTKFDTTHTRRILADSQVGCTQVSARILQTRENKFGDFVDTACMESQTIQDLDGMNAVMDMALLDRPHRYVFHAEFIATIPPSNPYVSGCSACHPTLS